MAGKEFPTFGALFEIITCFSYKSKICAHVSCKDGIPQIAIEVISQSTHKAIFSSVSRDSYLEKKVLVLVTLPKNIGAYLHWDQRQIRFCDAGAFNQLPIPAFVWFHFNHPASAVVTASPDIQDPVSPLGP